MADNYDGLTIGDTLTEEEIQRRNPEIYNNSLGWDKATGKIVSNLNTGGSGGGGTTDVSMLAKETTATDIKNAVDGLETLVTATNTALGTISSSLATKASESTLNAIKDNTDTVETLISANGTKLDNIGTAMGLGSRETTLSAVLTEAQKTYSLKGKVKLVTIPANTLNQALTTLVPELPFPYRLGIYTQTGVVKLNTGNGAIPLTFDFVLQGVDNKTKYDPNNLIISNDTASACTILVSWEELA